MGVVPAGLRRARSAAPAAVKWSALWYVLLFVALTLIFDISARRAAGSRHSIRDGILDDGALDRSPIGFRRSWSYLATWTGWFAPDDGYYRHWYAQANGHCADGLSIRLYNLWHYHHEAYKFHTGLSAQHQYQSWPLHWLLPVAPGGVLLEHRRACGAPQLCVGDPAARHAAAVVVVPAGADRPGLVRHRPPRLAGLANPGVCPRRASCPWMLSTSVRPTTARCSTSTPPAEPFLILAVVYVLGAIIAMGTIGSLYRKIATISLGVYLGLVAACFAYFYPIYTGKLITSRLMGSPHYG